MFGKYNKLLASIFFAFFFSFIYLSTSIHAHCPLCSTATAVVVATTRVYGVDDLIVGTFIGGVIVSTAFWTNNFLRKRNKGKDYISYQLPIVNTLFILLTIITFKFAGLLNNTLPQFMIFGIDKIILGYMIGSIITCLTPMINRYIRSFNKGKNYIPFQLMILTLILLSLTVIGFYSSGFI